MPRGWHVEPRGLADPDVARMIAEVQQEYVVLYGAPDAAAMDPREFTAPDGLFLVGVLDDDAVATGAWRRLAGGEAEIKRMYVAARARRRGLGRAMLVEVERTAVRAGVRRLVLSTGSRQQEAVAMYLAEGYVDCVPFGHYTGYSGAVFLAKDL